MRSQSSLNQLKAWGFFKPKALVHFESGENFSETFCPLSQNATAAGTESPEIDAWEAWRQ
ncbi:MAG TPA: hypothetical protein DEA71_15045 [Nitrospira sp.]|nr:hypothetical protein [Nitrospira sp.]